jgi:hypothetical protein
VPVGAPGGWALLGVLEGEARRLKVLVEASPKGHVHHLDPPADADGGQALLGGVAGQVELQPVPVRVHFSQVRVGFLAEEGGVHVGPARQEEAVQVGEEALQGLRGLGWDEGVGQALGGQGLEVGLQEAKEGAALEGAALGGDADEAHGSIKAGKIPMWRWQAWFSRPKA